MAFLWGGYSFMLASLLLIGLITITNRTNRYNYNYFIDVILSGLLLGSIWLTYPLMFLSVFTFYLSSFFLTLKSRHPKKIFKKVFLITMIAFSTSLPTTIQLTAGYLHRFGLLDVNIGEAPDIQNIDYGERDLPFKQLLEELLLFNLPISAFTILDRLSELYTYGMPRNHFEDIFIIALCCSFLSLFLKHKRKSSKNQNKEKCCHIFQVVLWYFFLMIIAQINDYGMLNSVKVIFPLLYEILNGYTSRIIFMSTIPLNLLLAKLITQGLYVLSPCVHRKSKL